MANVNDKFRFAITVVGIVHPELLHNGFVDPAATVGHAESVCVVCCSTASAPHDNIHGLVKAFESVAVVRAAVLSESGDETIAGIEIEQVPPGTKLSKIRRFAGSVGTDLICICDPDLTIVEDGCRAVLLRAIEDVRAGNEVVAFGVLEGRDDGTILSRVIAVDKWISHRVLRRCLWSLGVGITLPGQFMIVSPGLLRRLDPEVDSYLDDLYLGWVARQHRVRVHRLPVVVGQEDPRTSWGSLLTQRLRWMRGLASLFAHLWSQPTAAGLLSAHYTAYHALPILTMAGIISLVVVSPVWGLSVFFGLAAILAVMSKRPFPSAVVFLAVFPALHLLATLLWWMPVRRSILMRR
jgi:cellulose synthase/poly-beta-1,6-N-acetylglucosamine synthase-like glycosyltransferase